jgi:hypothetical protein
MVQRCARAAAWHLRRRAPRRGARRRPGPRARPRGTRAPSAALRAHHTGVAGRRACARRQRDGAHVGRPRRTRRSREAGATYSRDTMRALGSCGAARADQGGVVSRGEPARAHWLGAPPGHGPRFFRMVATHVLPHATGIGELSCRDGTSPHLVSSAAHLTAVTQAGQWQAPPTPACYAARLPAGRNAVAQYHVRRRTRSRPPYSGFVVPGRASLPEAPVSAERFGSR